MSSKNIKPYEVESLNSIPPEVLKGMTGNTETFEKAVARAQSQRWDVAYLVHVKAKRSRGWQKLKILAKCWQPMPNQIQPAEGFEPTTRALRKRCSTPELHWL